MSKQINPWRPRLGESVLYLDAYSRKWLRGTVWSYEGHTLIAVDLANGYRARFELGSLRRPGWKTLR